MDKIKIGPFYVNILYLAILAAVGLKVWLVLSDVVPFNGDEAVVALMARHINQGHVPLFFYGQAHMGSLDAMLVALGFQVFGEHVWVLRLVQGVLYLGTIITTAQLGKIAFCSIEIGRLGALLLAIPTVNVTLYTTATLGGYGEALLLGNIILLSGFCIGDKIDAEDAVPLWQWLLWGGLAGLGVWVVNFTLIYSVPMGFYLLAKLVKLWKGKKRLEVVKAVGVGILGAVIGLAPWWINVFQHGVQRIFVVTVSNQYPLLLAPFVHLFSLLLLGSTVTFGLRPPWDIIWLMLPLIPFILMIWMGVLVYSVKRVFRGQPNHKKVGVIGAVMLALVLVFVFTPFGNDPSGRYFVPLAIPLALFAASMIVSFKERSKLFTWGMVALILIFNLGGTIQSALRYPPGITTQFGVSARVDHRYDQELITFLEEEGINRGYSNCWVAYPLAFLSGEELIFVPRLPYRDDLRYTSGDDRYPPYGEMVAQADEVAYITTNPPALNEILREEFKAQGVEWQEKIIGDYHIFYALSAPVRPDVMSFGDEGL